MDKKDKRPVFKKWWFWIIVIIVIGGIYGSSQQDKGTVISSNGNSVSDNKKTEKTNFKVGETIAFDGKEVTVKSIDRDWKSDNQLSFNTFDWKIEDANGAIEGPSATAFTTNDNLNSGTLAINGKKEGSVIFEVAKDSTIKIHYQPSFWSNKKIVIEP